MRHQVFGKKLHRPKKERESLFKLLASEFFLNDKLTTSPAKAKAVQPLIEHFVTQAKKNKVTGRKIFLSKINNKKLAEKIIAISEQFKTRNGGYTRVLKLPARAGDNSKQVILLWSQELVIAEKPDGNNKQIENKTKPDTVSKKDKEIKSEEKLIKRGK